MFEDKPLKITIITPVFNGASYLEETILSVINQDYPNLEYIIIDGGSTDESVEIIKKYEKHLAYWVSEPDDGLYHAIQKGFEKSTGEIMAWINSDDMYHRGAFSIVAELFLKFPQIEWIMGMPSAYDEQSRTIFVHDFKLWCKAKFLTIQDEWIQQESVFWRRSLWQKAGSQVNTTLKLAGDFELWTRFFRHAELYSLQVLLGGFRIRSANQLSFEHIEDYKAEVQEVVKSERSLLPAEYIHKLDSIKQFNDKLSSHKIRILKSLYFRNNYKKIKLFEQQLFKYPPQVNFDRLKQNFYIS
jgi:glycosyltransferase involved in cell wall biosynthesis